MSLHINVSLLVAVLLVSVRIGALFLFSPLFSVARVPIHLWVTFVLLMSYLLLLGTANYEAQHLPTDLGTLVPLALSELLIGAIMGFGVFTAFAAFQFGGRILDIQMGFGVANLIDPSSNSQNPLLGTILALMAVMAFFMVDGHHMLIRGIVYSLQIHPPGELFTAFNIQSIIHQFGSMFVFGIAVAAPAVFTLLLLDVGMSIAARTMPQVNMFIIGIPIKIFVGLVVVAVSLNYLAPLLERIYASIFFFWKEALR
jgi:flagellar biosynthetic protein FliR